MVLKKTAHTHSARAAVQIDLEELSLASPTTRYTSCLTHTIGNDADLIHTRTFRRVDNIDNLTVAQGGCSSNEHRLVLPLLKDGSQTSGYLAELNLLFIH